MMLDRGEYWLGQPAAQASDALADSVVSGLEGSERFVLAGLKKAVK